MFGFAFIFFMFSLVALVLSSLFIRTQNTSLTIKIQQMNEEIATIQNENNSLNIEIQTLGNKERVFEVAKASNLDLNNSNVIAVIGE